MAEFVIVAAGQTAQTQTVFIQYKALHWLHLVALCNDMGQLSENREQQQQRGKVEL